MRRMPNIKSAIKRAKTNEKAYMENKAKKTALRSQIRKYDSAIAEENREAAEMLYPLTAKQLDKAVAKGLIHKNKAANLKSSMAKRLNALNAAE